MDFVFERKKRNAKKKLEKNRNDNFDCSLYFQCYGKINKTSLNKEMLYSAEYMQEEQQNKQNQK